MRRLLLPLVATLGLGACTAAPASDPTTTAPTPAPSSTAPLTSSPASPLSVYAAAGAGMLAPAAKEAKPLVYVPDQVGSYVETIDPATLTVVAKVKVARSPEHVVPSYDLKTLWVNSDTGDTLTPIDPKTGTVGSPIHVDDPYNLYFTPDGSAALVMAERLERIDVRDPHTMALRRSLKVPCEGLNHADYTTDLTTFVASCEFSGKLLVVDANATTIAKVVDLNSTDTPGATSPHVAHSMDGPKHSLVKGASSMPQDVRLTPDGRFFLAADMLRNGVWVIDANTFTINRFIQTGLGAHGIYPSRDAKRLFVSNRDAGTVTVLDAATLTQVALWHLPGKATPDMGGVSADGSRLWLSGRYSDVVYVIDTATGRTEKTIRTKASPHGLCVWPQPGRYSLGHTGNMR